MAPEVGIEHLGLELKPRAGEKQHNLNILEDSSSGSQQGESLATEHTLHGLTNLQCKISILLMNLTEYYA